MLAALAVALLCVTAAPAAAAAPKAKRSIAGGYAPADDQWPWVTAVIDQARPVPRRRFRAQFLHLRPDRTTAGPDRRPLRDHRRQRDTPVAGRLQVLVGRRNLLNGLQGERRNVTGIAVHPKAYLPATGVHTHHAFYDIAVLFLDSPVATTPAPIGTPQDWGYSGTVMGWGHNNYDHDNPQYDEYLRAADYELLSDARCSAAFDDADGQHFFGTIHVCANNSQNTTNVDCITHGDSGGPLMVKVGGAWKLIGITSFYPHRTGDRCGAGGPFGSPGSPARRCATGRSPSPIHR